MKGPVLRGNVQTTSASQVHAFLYGLDDNTKLRGKINKNGDFVLYTGQSNKALDRMKAQVAGHRGGARKVISSLVSELKRQTEKDARVVSDHGAMSVFSNLEQVLRGTRKSSLRSAQARIVLRVATGENAALKAKRSRTEPSCMSRVGPIAGLLGEVAERLRNGTREDAIHDLAIGLIRAGREHLNADEIESFIFADGASEVEALDEAWGEASEGLFRSPQDKRDFLKAAFLKAAEGIGEDGAVDGRLQTIRIGGVVYERGDQLGEGSFARVYKFVSEDGTRAIAVKIAGEDPNRPGQPLRENAGDVIAESGREYRLLKAAYGDGSTGIIRPEGAFRTANNIVVQALEYAPNSTLYGAMFKLNEAVAAGHLTKHAAAVVRRTLLKDLAIGTQAMQRHGVLHGDYKTPNVMIGADGRSKITDFGTAQISDEYHVARSTSVDNPSWLAPEILTARTEKTAYKGRTHEKIAGVVKDARDWIEGAFARVGLDQTQSNNLLAGMFAKDTDRAVDGTSAGRQIDIWAYGVCAHDLLYGHQLMDDEKFVFKQERRLMEFLGDHSNKAVGFGGKFTPESSGFDDEEDLINWCMHPDPSRRPSAEEILDHRVFAMKDVGSDAAYEVIKALMTGDFKNQEQLRAQRLRELGGMLLED